QAEDGIRDRNVTGVQTCALPIFASRAGIDGAAAPGPAGRTVVLVAGGAQPQGDAARPLDRAPPLPDLRRPRLPARSALGAAAAQIGRASCRERVTFRSHMPSSAV